MKINNLTDSLRLDRTTGANGQPQPAAAATGTAATGSKVELSDLAARLSQLETQFANSDFDAKKVEEIRTAITEGRFTVDAGSGADKLLASVDELLGRKA